MSDFQLGQHEAKIEALQISVTEMSVKLDGIVAFVHKIEGAWQTGAWALGLAGAFIGAIFSFLASLIRDRMSA